MSEYRTFVIPFDFSAHARAALHTATDLARPLAADLHLIHVIQSPSALYTYGPFGGGAPPPPIDLAAVHRDARRSLRETNAEIEDVPGKIEPHVVEGAGLADTLCECASELGADLIVMGTHGRTGLAHLFLGSVAERTIGLAPCPVLTVRVPERDESREGDADPRRSGATSGESDPGTEGSAPTDAGRMETLREALARLEGRGFVQAFQAREDGRLTLPDQASVAPEELVVEETVRFEGQSDPADQAVLFALRSRDGRVRGTFVMRFGPEADPEDAAAIHRLAPDPNRRPTTEKNSRRATKRDIKAGPDAS
jgi:nucleotide-binding universal stress UspA family protein